MTAKHRFILSVFLFTGFCTFFFFFFLFFQYNFIEHTRVQLTFTKDNLQQNENYNLKLTKKKSNTIKTLVVLKWERNQLSKQNFTPYLRETKKQTIFFAKFSHSHFCVPSLKGKAIQVSVLRDVKLITILLKVLVAYNIISKFLTQLDKCLIFLFVKLCSSGMKRCFLDF